MIWGCRLRNLSHTIVRVRRFKNAAVEGLPLLEARIANVERPDFQVESKLSILMLAVCWLERPCDRWQVGLRHHPPKASVVSMDRRRQSILASGWIYCEPSQLLFSHP